MSDADREWAAALDRHRPALVQWAEVQTPGWVRAKFDPADLVQQTLLEVLRIGEKLDGRSDLEVLAFLRRALTNNLIDAARKFARSRADISPDAFSQSCSGLANWLTAPDTSPSERAVRNERFARLATGLAGLPDDQRVAVEMRYLQGLKVSAIARLLERSAGAVSQLLHRAVTALRHELAEFDI